MAVKFRVHLRTGRFEDHDWEPQIDGPFLIFHKRIKNEYKSPYGSQLSNVLDTIYPADMILYVERVEE